MFLHVSVILSRGGWYPSMPCRSPGPHPGGKLRGLAGAVSRPTSGGGGLQAYTWGKCVFLACTEADSPPPRQFFRKVLPNNKLRRLGVDAPFGKSEQMYFNPGVHSHLWTPRSWGTGRQPTCRCRRQGASAVVSGCAAASGWCTRWVGSRVRVSSRTRRPRLGRRTERSSGTPRNQRRNPT